jgi:hypothetical protein
VPLEAVTIALDEVTIAPGATGKMRAVLDSSGAQVAGVQMDLVLDAGLVVAARENGEPDCAVAPDIGKQLFVRERPLGHCGPFACQRLRALVLSLSDTAPIADGELFRCTLLVDPETEATRLRVHLTGAGASDPLGNTVATIDVMPGVVLVPQPPTPTSTITRTPRSTATLLPEEERTRRPTSTPRPTRTVLADATVPPTRTATAARVTDDDGCAVAPGSGGAHPLLLVTLALLLAARRRPRGL